MDLDVLITAIPGDMHAAAVSVALERQGLRVGRWYPVAYPRADEISFALAERAVPRVTLSLAGGRVFSLPDDQLQTFWFRRQGLPILSDKVHPADLEFQYKKAYPDRPIPEAYERLLLDALNGDATLFMRSDEIERAWQIIDPFLAALAGGQEPAPQEYATGSEGPACADEFIRRDGREWVAAGKR